MKTKKGFTLIELLVVIAIIALLMSILMPALAAVRKKARNVSCVMNLKSWGGTFGMWLTDHDNFFMDGKLKWFYALAPYYNAKLRTVDIRGEYKIRLCPLATKYDDNGGVQPYEAWRWAGTGAGAQAASGAEIWQQWYWDGSYGTNSYIYTPPPGSELSSSYAPYWKTSNVQNTDKIPLLLDSESYGGRPTSQDTPVADASQLDAEVTAGLGADFMNQFCIDRHSGFTQGVFLDFSARQIGLKELWTFQWSRNFNICDKYTMCGTHGSKIGWPLWMVKYKEFYP